jgi:hypothetical protein
MSEEHQRSHSPVVSGMVTRPLVTDIPSKESCRAAFLLSNQCWYLSGCLALGCKSNQLMDHLSEHIRESLIGFCPLRVLSK